MIGEWWWVELLAALIALVALYHLRQPAPQRDAGQSVILLRIEYRGQICFCTPLWPSGSPN